MIPQPPVFGSRRPLSRPIAQTPTAGLALRLCLVSALVGTATLQPAVASAQDADDLLSDPDGSENWEDDDGPSGTFEPAWDDEEDEYDDLEDEEDEELPGGTFEPSFEDEEDEVPGGTFLPAYEDEDVETTSPPDETDTDVPISPPNSSEETPAGALTPDDDAYWLQLEAEEEETPEEDDTDWNQYWQVLEQETPTEDVEVPQQVAEGRGGVTGVLVDDAYAEPIAGTEITIEGTTLTQTTGVNGVFFLELEPGTYVLRARNFNYVPLAYEILVEADTITDMAQLRMVADASRTMTMVVEGRFDRESVATQLMERRESTTVQDTVSAEQIARAGDSSASSAVRRVVGATIVDGRFLFVRGLGGRYTDVLLNGVPVPKTDPVYPGVELDIFPTDLLSQIILYKNPQGDLPAAFAGGLMNVTTRAYPEEFTLSASISLSGDTATTFRERVDYQGGTLDWLGFDDGTRALPNSVPENEAVRVQDAISGSLSPADVERIAEDFSPRFGFDRTLSLPGLGLRATVGDSGQLGGRRAGYLVTARYSIDHERRADGVVQNLDSNVDVRETLDRETGETSVLWGGLGTGNLEIAEGHDLTLLTMWNQSATDTTELVRGRTDEENLFGERVALQFVQRSLWFSQLQGSHRRLLPSASPLHELGVDWSLSFSSAFRDEPDTRYLLRFRQDDDTYAWRPNPGSGERFFSQLDQRDYNGSASITIPWTEVFKARLGFDGSLIEREFAARRFRYTLTGTADPSLRFREPNELFVPETIGQSSIRMQEVVAPENFYASDQLGLAGFLQTEARPFSWLRVAAGVRYESFTRSIEAGSEIAPARDGTSLERVENDLLPSGALIFSLTETQFLRANYGMSLARPTTNEFAPFQTQDYVRRRVVAGNPALERTRIHNADLRWEWFPTTTEVIAISGFYKNFQNPIERNVLDSAGQVLGFENADAAQNFGVEVETRVGLGYVHDTLDDLSLGVNFAWIESQIDLPCTPSGIDGRECVEKYTNQSRPMAGQSPYVVNVALGYEPAWGLSTFLFYNVFGDRISDVGRNGRPDEYESSFHALDVAVGYSWADAWKTNLRVRNLLLQDREFRVGSVVAESTPQPLEISLSLSWDY